MTMLLAITISAMLAAHSDVPYPPQNSLRLQAQHAARTLAASPAPGAWQQRDSLKNGAIIGAAIGGLGFGSFVGLLCHALDETEGHGDCIKAALLAGGVGAAGGAAIGVGIDALFDSRRGYGGSRGYRGFVRVRF